jgi:serine/threonine protein kinase
MMKTATPENLAASPELTATAILPEPFGSGRPMSAQERSKFLDRVYDEFCDLRAAGVDVDPEEFCTRYPELQASLRKLFLAHNEISGDLESVRHAAGSWPQPGEEFLGYSLLGELGRGTFARVFLARELNLGGRLVAVKLTLHDTNEPATLGRLQHPGVVPVYSARYDVATGFTVVVMPFLGGCTFCHVLDYLRVLSNRPQRASVFLDAAQDDRWSAEGAPPPEPVLRRGWFLEGVLHIGAAMADALASVHGQGFLHRDLKPSNVLLTPNGRPVLLDFNLAHNQEVADYRLCGTLPYMPPEQLSATVARRQGDPADGRRDLFGLAVMLYELLAGVHPFGPVPLRLKSPEIREYLLGQQQRGPKPLRKIDPSIDPALDRLLQRCLAWDPEVRPATAAEFAAELRRLLSPTRRLRRWAERHAQAIAAATVLAAVPAAYGVHAVATMPPAAVRQAQSGEEHYREGRYAEAIKSFTDSLEADGDQADVRFKRARAYQKAGVFADAILDYEHNSLQNDARAMACRGYCYSHDLIAHHSHAIVAYKQAIAGGFANAIVWSDLAYSQLRLCKYADAEESATKALDLDLNLRAAMHNRALARLQLTLADKTKSYDAAAGLVDCQGVIARGPAAAEDYLLAARLLAVNIKNRTSRKFAVDRAEAVKYLSVAIEKGFPRDEIVNDPVLVSAKLAAAVPQVQQKEPRTAPPAFQERLLDPLHGTGD